MPPYRTITEVWYTIEPFVVRKLTRRSSTKEFQPLSTTDSDKNKHRF
jgi:hypothetical protein